MKEKIIKDKSERIIGIIIASIGALTEFIRELSKEMYMNAFVSLYILFCCIIHILTIEKEIEKSDIWKIIYAHIIELVFGIVLAISVYKYEYGGMLLMGAVLLLLAFFEIWAVIAIIKFYKKEKNN